ncbi:hypothetical protein G3T14_05455 [Methylobacterium sp. BTF04]|uniref:hypothetical protein n=1 Tax=Methylobacterium sp. BTF04 TaxID=2708300 RepID=UPI0013D5929B|nr:hypothetical protein [Methylobacterium sp. BTF04]NEU11573.1 hypothetical protein [Methylobacterium sp. BTF04]
MAQAALQATEDFDSTLVRRLMARPLRVVREADIVPLHQPAPVDAKLGVDVSRLQAEVMVMKAVLGAERRETERLRQCLSRVEEPAPLGPEAQAVRDRWAALVHELLHMPR